MIFRIGPPALSGWTAAAANRPSRRTAAPVSTGGGTGSAISGRDAATVSGPSSPIPSGCGARLSTAAAAANPAGRNDRPGCRQINGRAHGADQVPPARLPPYRPGFRGPKGMPAVVLKQNSCYNDINGFFYRKILWNRPGSPRRPHGQKGLIDRWLRWKICGSPCSSTRKTCRAATSKA